MLSPWLMNMVQNFAFYCISKLWPGIILLNHEIFQSELCIHSTVIWFNQAKVQKEMPSKRSNWTEGKFSQARAQQPSQEDCNIKLTHPTRTIQKLAEDLFGEKRNHLLLFFRKVLDTYSIIETLCNETISQKCYHLEYCPKFCFFIGLQNCKQKLFCWIMKFFNPNLYSFYGNMIQSG